MAPAISISLVFSSHVIKRNIVSHLSKPLMCFIAVFHPFAHNFTLPSAPCFTFTRCPIGFAAKKIKGFVEHTLAIAQYVTNKGSKDTSSKNVKALRIVKNLRLQKEGYAHDATPFLMWGGTLNTPPWNTIHAGCQKTAILESRN